MRVQSILSLVPSLLAAGITCGPKKFLYAVLTSFLLASWILLGGFPINTASAQELKTIKVGIIPIIDVLPLFTGIEKGYFRDEGLKLELVPFRGGSLVVSAMAGGSVRIGFASVQALIESWAQGFRFMIIADDVYIAKSSAIMVRRDSNINRIKDLQGKTVGVNGIKHVAWLYIRELMEKGGGNPDQITWLEVPFPRMAVALINRSVDAGEMVEPFVTIAKEKHPELKIISYYLHDTNPGGMLAVYLANKKWIGKNPILVERFARAHKRGVDYVNAHTDEARIILTRHTRLTPQLAKKVVIKTWRNKVDIKNLQWKADLLLKHGLIKKRQNVEEMVYKTAR